MGKKFIGIFYKSPWLWLHYLPSVIGAQIVMHLILRLFLPVNEWYILMGILFNISLFISLYFVVAVVDQFVHALLDLIGVKD